MNTREAHTRCNRCGCLAVAWRNTKAGKWYLAISTTPDSSPETKAYFRGGAGRRPHTCDTHTNHHSDRMEASQFGVAYVATEATKAHGGVDLVDRNRDTARDELLAKIEAMHGEDLAAKLRAYALGEAE